MKVGFIGLGIMGRPMAGHVQAGGHELLVVRHRAPFPEELLSGGAIACASPRAVADAAEVVILMVPDTPDVEAVLFAPDGVAEAIGAGKIVVDMSSISPATKTFAARIGALGGGYLDAPVSGGEVGAKNAALTIMVGGPEETFATVKPLFELMGKTITLVGTTSGDGQVCKVANQIIVALTLEAISEALVFVAKAGADPAKVREALLGGFASSRILEVHGERMITRSFDPGFRIALHQKDLGLALQAARELGVSLPNTATCQELFNVCAAQGGSDWDHSALVRALETLAGCEIGAAPAGS